jgi:hypothetical protein
MPEVRRNAIANYKGHLCETRIAQPFARFASSTFASSALEKAFKRKEREEEDAKYAKR